ncbi:putative lipid II flippase FtsW [Candidatus Parcubacteria bacterium]|nr:putative lipid II flippase FtsW [Candidatus Parcubacteria bacterium]
MAKARIKVDKPFLVSVIILIIAGFFIFSSASLGLLAKSGSQYSSVTFSQTFLGLFLGSLAMMLFSRLDYKIWRKYAFHLLAFSILLNILVLIPHVGFEHGGARRWFVIGSLSFQPSELMKLAFVIYFAAWAAGKKDKIQTFKYGFAPLLALFAICGGLLLKQPDTDNFMMIIFSGIAIYLAAGGKWRYVLGLAAIGAIGLVGLALTRPYVMQRITTFVHPENNAQGSSYQIQQSLIAIGSGGFTGRGFGQSIQKFNFLPEPIGDSIFAVEAEEFGFVGAVTLILLFVFFSTRGLKIASRVTDPFGRLLVVGIVIMIVAQAFVNIGAMLGVLPLSGITLPFVSHGGTSLFITLLEVGIILSISKTQKAK